MMKQIKINLEKKQKKEKKKKKFEDQRFY